jgi:Arc/MetJ family transcription regulator
MRRTHLVLDAELLDEARRVLGTRTYSATVSLALEEIVRVRKVQNLASFFGKGLWQGNLSQMREDRRRAKGSWSTVDRG